VLEVDNVSKTYPGTCALDGISFAAGDGEIVGLLGPHGAGKTTLVSVICGLVRPDHGRVAVAGHEVAKDGAAARGHLGVAAQDVALVQSLSVRQNLKFFASLSRRRPPDIDERIDELARDFDLVRLLDRKVLTLSGGQQRRVHVAVALARDADVLLLDEPTAGSDLESRDAILRRIQRERDAGHTILYTSHGMDEITELGARVLILDRGRVVADSTVPELLAEHTHPAVEVRFSRKIKKRPPPGAVVEGPVVRVTSADSARAIADLLRWGKGVDVVSVDVVRPGLAAAFVALTGRQFDEGDDSDGAAESQ